MKIPGLDYEFETELEQLQLRAPIKPSRSSAVMPSATSGPTIQLLLDANNELVAVLRWGTQADRQSKKPPTIALVPFSNVASMVPLLKPAPAETKPKAA